MQTALGAEDGTVAFDQSPFLAGSHVSIGGNTRVRVMRLDDCDLPAADFIKIDVEGYEPNVLAGGVRSLTGPLVMMEVNAFALDCFDRTSTTAMLSGILETYGRFIHLRDGKPVVVTDAGGVFALTYHLIADPSPCWTDIAFSSDPARLDGAISRLNSR